MCIKMTQSKKRKKKEERKQKKKKDLRKKIPQTYTKAWGAAEVAAAEVAAVSRLKKGCPKIPLE